MDVFIRLALMDDADAVASLSDQLGYTTSPDEMLIRLEKVLNSAADCVFVAICNGKVAGWIHGFQAFRVESEPFVEIGGLVIDDHYRGNGLGKLLAEELCKWSITRNCKTIRVRSNIKRKEAHSFYKKIGFTEIKEQKVFTLQLT